MQLSIYQVDAFTDHVFGGNPAAVCPLDHWLDTQLMQAIGMENNLAETAFFVPKGDDFELRWFTPEIEVDLCGHATLASAHVLFEHLGYQGEEIRFHTQSGLLTVRRKGKYLIMDFPAWMPKKVEMSSFLLEGLGIRPLEVYKSRDFVAVLASEDDVLQCQPIFSELAKLDALGIIITAEGKNSDFVSRFFAPSAGILEDPVTGSAHSTLTPFWAKKLGKNELSAIQLSPRKGHLWCEYFPDTERVTIQGQAVTFLKGTIEIG
jgi:PhzF family phenazine biosynthesis protein